MTPRGNPTVNHGLEVAEHQCGFIDYNKCTSGRDVYRAEHGRGEKGKGLWENSASIQFCCEQL